MSPIRDDLIAAGVLIPAPAELQLRRVTMFKIGLPLNAEGAAAARRHALHGENGRKLMTHPHDRRLGVSK